jgi:hypothetical protein
MIIDHIDRHGAFVIGPDGHNCESPLHRATGSLAVDTNAVLYSLVSTNKRKVVLRE